MPGGFPLDIHGKEVVSGYVERTALQEGSEEKEVKRSEANHVRVAPSGIISGQKRAATIARASLRGVLDAANIRKW
jgi:hypothetical protein